MPTREDETTASPTYEMAYVNVYVSAQTYC